MLLFISDLHLAAQRPETVRLFLRFLEEQAATAQALYILGDLFDAWIGDDFQAPPIPQIQDAMRALSRQGCNIYLMHGNRDFLLGEAFAQASGCTLLDDPTSIDLQGTPTLLMHGDQLCTDDVEYQKARQLLRNPAFIEDFLSRSIPERIQLAQEYRQRSGEAVSNKPADIMDVNQQAVEQYMKERGTTRLIHGHTHRPGTHQFELNGQPAQRIVLPEWHSDSGGYLRADESGLTQMTFA